MKADMSGVRTIPKLMELQQECLAQHEAEVSSSSDESDNEDIDASAIPGLLNITIPPTLVQQADAGHQACEMPTTDHLAAQHPEQQQGDESQSSDEGSEDESDAGSYGSQANLEGMSPADLKAARKAHKKAVKEANRERRKHKMPKHVKKKKMNSHKKKK